MQNTTIKMVDNLRDQQITRLPSSNERSTKRRKRDRDKEEAEEGSDLSDVQFEGLFANNQGSEDLNKSVAPSRYGSETRENILGFTANGLAEAEVPDSRFDEMIALESDFPPELLGLVYDDLAKQFRFHQSVEYMNEMTRQTIVHSLLVTICLFIDSKHLEKSAPRLSLLLFYFIFFFI